MEITSSFLVPLSPDETWNALLDFERVASSMPGARLDEVDGDEVKGSVTVKLGPMKVEYRGIARVDASDVERRELRIAASGDETRGTGSASANISTRLEPEAAGTSVNIVAEVSITGRPAQMGVGLIQDVAKRLTNEFADRLQNELVGQTPESQVEVSTSKGGTELDLLRVAGGPVARRAAVGLALVGVIWLIRRLFR